MHDSLKNTKAATKDQKSDLSHVAELRHRNACESPLLRVPAEIRLWIYGYVLEGGSARMKSKRTTDPLSYDRPPGPLVVLERLSHIPHGVGLLSTCYQIHTESKSLPIKYDTIEFVRYTDLLYARSTFTLAQLQAVTRIQFRILVPEHYHRPAIQPLVSNPQGIYGIFPNLQRIEVQFEPRSWFIRVGDGEHSVYQSWSKLRRVNLETAEWLWWQKLVASKTQSKVCVDFVQAPY